MLAAVLPILLILQHGHSSVNLRSVSQSHLPESQQYFIERPANLTVIEGQSVTLKCTIGSLAGKVQWTTDGFALGYEQSTIKSYCSKCRARGDPNKGEFHLLVEDVELGRYNKFECQVSPDTGNNHKMIRAAASLNVIVPPEKMELVDTETSVSLHSGTEQALSCRASGAKPPAKIVWYHGHNRILDQEYSKTTNPSLRTGTWDTTNTLKFRATPQDDGSTISCVVEHPALQQGGTDMRKDIDLTVFYSPGKPRILGDTESAYTQGEMINLTCLSSGGNPPPVLSWYKNNVQLQYPYERLSNGSTVSIMAMRAEENLLTDRFDCRARNKYSNALSSGTVKFNVTFSGDRVHITGPDTGQIGATLQLSCSSEESNPPSIIKWEVDGKEMPGTQEQVAVDQGGWRSTSVIQLRVDVNLSQMKVTCSAFNNFFSDVIRDSKTIRILRPPEAPSISGLPSKSLREGDPLTLSCIAQHGNPLPTLKWFKQGEFIPTQSQRTVADSHTIADLTLTVNRRDNDMEYSCEASNQAHFPSVSQRTNFTVYFEPDIARLSLSKSGPAAPDILQARVGDRLQWNCAAGNSKPAAKITWFKNGFETKGGPVSASPGKYGGVKLTQVYLINDGMPVTSKHNGANYTCVVANPAILGRNVTRTTTLDILYPPEFDSETKSHYEVVEGDTARMEVVARGNPTVQKYTWSYSEEHNKPLEVSNLPPRFHIDGFKLTISQVKREDAGKYLFKATNGMGDKTMEIQLSVFYGPNITFITEELTVDEGGKAVFHCKVEANPLNAQSVVWEAVGARGPRQFNFSTQAHQAWDGKDTFTLTIDRVRKADRGKFSCVATNSVSSYTSQAVLKVKFKPEIRKFPRFSKFAVNQMHQIDLECVAYGYPKVNIFWKKAGSANPERFTFNNKGTTVQESFDTWKSVLRAPWEEFDTWKSQLYIESALFADYTIYECTAENELGEDKFNISLTSPRVPEPPQNLEVSKVDHNAVRLKWEPGFDGGFKQEFITKIKEVKTGIELKHGSNYSRLDPAKEFVQQVVIIEPNVEYAFSVEAVNVQGSSGFTEEKRKSLTASETTAKEESTVPRVIIVALVLATILSVIIILMIITCCVKQKRDNRRKNERKNERSSSCSSKRSMMIERYPPSKYSNAFGGDMFISPPSHCGSSASGSHEPDYKYLARSLSMPGQESDRGYTSYAGSCSVHGTLKRHISSGIDTAMEDDVFDDFSHGTETKKNGQPGYPIHTADRMLKPNGRSRAGSLSSPNGPPAPPRLGVSGLYTDYMERRKYSEAGSISPPCIPSPPPPVTTSTLERLRSKASAFPLPPPSFPHCNGHINMIDVDTKKSAVEASSELTRRINELSKERCVEPKDALGHLQLNHLPNLPTYPSQPRTMWHDNRTIAGSSNFM